MLTSSPRSPRLCGHRVSIVNEYANIKSRLLTATLKPCPIIQFFKIAKSKYVPIYRFACLYGDPCNVFDQIKRGVYILKGAVSQDFLPFFISWIEAIWAPDEQAKMVLLKNSFSRRYSQKIRLRAVLACAESDSAQANTARSRQLKCPQIRNWLTLRRVRLCAG